MKYELGSVVQLASGGPRMTVTENVGESSRPGSQAMCRCGFFKDGGVYGEIFVVEAALVVSAAPLTKIRELLATIPSECEPESLSEIRKLVDA